MIAKIGLTGGIGSGKSAVAQCFKKLGVYVIDADRVSRDLVKPGTPQYHAVVDHFGQKVVSESGALDRKTLGQIVFSDTRERAFLEALLHPAIRENMHRAVEENATIYGVLEIPLLIEGKQHVLMDKVVVVACSRSNRIERLQNHRGMTVEMIEKVMSSQLPDEERMGFADDIVDNNHSLEHTFDQVKALHQKYLHEFSA